MQGLKQKTSRSADQLAAQEQARVAKTTSVQRMNEALRIHRRLAKLAKHNGRVG